MTITNMETVLALVDRSQRHFFLGNLPRRSDVITRTFPETEAEIHALATYYVKCFPESTWEFTAHSLYICGQIAALDKVYLFCTRQSRGERNDNT